MTTPTPPDAAERAQKLQTICHWMQSHLHHCDQYVEQLIALGVNPEHLVMLLLTRHLSDAQGIVTSIAEADHENIDLFARFPVAEGGTDGC